MGYGLWAMGERVGSRASLCILIARDTTAALMNCGRAPTMVTILGMGGTLRGQTLRNRGTIAALGRPLVSLARTRDASTFPEGTIVRASTASGRPSMSSNRRPHRSSQFSSLRSGTRSNSRVLSVTRTASRNSAYAAMRKSMAPIGVPFSFRCLRILP